MDHDTDQAVIEAEKAEDAAIRARVLDELAAERRVRNAAPDLLAAAKALIALQDQTDPEGLFRSYEGTALRAAIAKAEGRS